jgi:hypothetical protein
VPLKRRYFYQSRDYDQNWLEDARGASYLAWSAGCAGAETKEIFLDVERLAYFVSEKVSHLDE